jgi:AAA15 family ATPase/GTPase
LQLLNTGIVRFERIQQEPMPEELRSKLNSFNRAVEELLGQGAKAEIVGEQHNVRFVHQSADGNGVQFEADEESAGSRRLILLLHQVFSALDSGGTLVVDELDASLHTQACRQVVRLFLDKDLNQHGAQLIFTTHDTNVLADGLLRRDEVWIVEKDVAGESHLYPLTDFKLRKTENVERIYLEGRLGGIPDKFDVNWLLADG